MNFVWHVTSQRTYFDVFSLRESFQQPVRLALFNRGREKGAEEILKNGWNATGIRVVPNEAAVIHGMGSVAFLKDKARYSHSVGYTAHEDSSRFLAGYSLTILV
ncbi:hypothetical protein [Streptomyces tendae]|uniref:hypothetical protein n=1 Tax=Streptomyces tendae TaxID=1932 RepID=UPI0036A04D85